MRTNQNQLRSRRDRARIFNRIINTVEPLEERLLLTTYGPLITFDSWNQNGLIPGSTTINYNDYCPIDPATNQRSVTGCVATAEAQILYYWHYPTSLSFTSSDAYTQSNGSIVFDTDSTKDSFPNFSALTTLLSNIQYNFDPTEIAALSFGAGIKSQANYTSDATGAQWHDQVFAKFGFQSGQEAFLSTDGYDAIKTLLISNMQGGMPVGMVIDTTGSAHAIIIDGYNSTTDQFHLDLGWGGYDDGWYDLPSFTAGYDWTMRSVLYNLRPTLPVPTNVIATAGFGTSVSVTWSASQYASGYQVWRSETNDSNTAVKVTTTNLNPTVTTYLDNAVAPGHSYYYWIKAVSDIGSSNFSNSALGFRSNVPPVTPTNITPAAGATGIGLTPVLTASPYSDLTGKSHLATEWVVVRNADGAVVFDSGVDTTHLDSFTLSSGILQNSSLYSWKVRYQNSAGLWSSFSTLTSFKTVELPPSVTFVTRLYNEVLDRDPDTTTLSYWQTLLDARVVTTDQVAASVVNSQEHRTMMIQDVYQSILGRSADSTGLANWLTFLNTGHTIEEMKSGFYGSLEYMNNHGGTNSSVIQAFYQEILGRTADNDGLIAWTNMLNSGTLRKIVAYAIMTTSVEGATHLVNQCYTNYLHRSGDDDGIANWVTQIRRGVSAVTIQIGFLGSVEYSQIV